MLERAKRASHIDPPASSNAIMRRARPYCGENPEPGKDVTESLTPRPELENDRDPTRTSARLLLRLQCASLNSIRPLCNGWEQALYFFPQVRDGIVIAGEMPQQASLEKSVKQRIEGASGDERLSSTN